MAPDFWWLLETSYEFWLRWSSNCPGWPHWSTALGPLSSFGRWRVNPLVRGVLKIWRVLPSAAEAPLSHFTLHPTPHNPLCNFGPNQFCLSPTLINLTVILGPAILSPYPLSPSRVLRLISPAHEEDSHFIASHTSALVTFQCDAQMITGHS